MRDDYKLIGPTAKVEVAVEKDIAEKLSAMETYSKFFKVRTCEYRAQAIHRFTQRFFAARNSFGQKVIT